MENKEAGTPMHNTNDLTLIKTDSGYFVSKLISHSTGDTQTVEVPLEELTKEQLIELLKKG